MVKKDHSYQNDADLQDLTVLFINLKFLCRSNSSSADLDSGFLELHCQKKNLWGFLFVFITRTESQNCLGCRGT